MSGHIEFTEASVSESMDQVDRAVSVLRGHLAERVWTRGTTPDWVRAAYDIMDALREARLASEKWRLIAAENEATERPLKPPEVGRFDSPYLSISFVDEATKPPEVEP